MAAIPKQTKPPTAAEAREALTAHEAELLQARRANATARGAISRHKAAGDEEAELQCRRTIAATAKQIEALKEAIEIDQQTVAAVCARDHSAFNAKRYRTLSSLATAMVNSSATLEQVITQFAAARSQAQEAAAEFEAELSRCSITFDAFLSHATRLDGRVEMLLWLETGGSFGRTRTLETPEQLKQNGRASLHLAATEFRGVALRSARVTLGFSTDEVT
jgi:hypothetical protein